MRRVYHFLLQVYQKLMIQKIIRDIDSHSPIQQKIASSSLMQKGWESFTSDYFFNLSISNYVENNFKDKKIQHDPYGNWISRDIPFDLMNMIVGSKKIKEVVTDYLGEDARLDDMYYWFKEGTAVTKNLSEGWHDDNVGHRLKFFICLGAGPDSSRTCIVPGTNKRLYKFNIISEFKRFFNLNKGQESFETAGAYDEVSYQKDMVFVLDTNGVHRGNYSNLPGHRNCIIVEFANKFKSNAISGKAPCGPGQHPAGEILIKTNEKNILFENSLIDHNILKNYNSDVFSYSISNLQLK